MKVPFLDYKKLYSHYQPGVDEAMKQALVSGHMILQEDVEEFERKFAEFLGVKHVVGLNSGTDALLLALVAADVGAGDEVITVSHTFIATIQVIHHLGATPVLVDVGEDGLMDIEQVYKARTDKTKAIIPVHLSGDYVENIANRDIDADTFTHFAYKNGIEVIEDAAQAIGAKGVGYGLAQCYSFYPAKVLGTFGDAGALVTSNSDIANRVRSLRNHGGVTKYDQESYEYGWNSRMDNVWAAVLNEKLDYLPTDLKKREAVAHRYLEALQGYPLILPVDRPGRIWQDFVIRTEQQVELITHLKKNGIETLGGGMVPNHKHPGLGLDHFSLPNTEKWVATSVRLPCNQFISSEEVEYVIANVKSFYE